VIIYEIIVCFCWFRVQNDKCTHNFVKNVFGKSKFDYPEPGNIENISCENKICGESPDNLKREVLILFVFHMVLQI
jgi:hypothetical protein